VSGGPSGLRSGKFFALNRKTFFLRSLFAGFALLFVGIIALRPVPSVSAPNDTGRYVATQLESCTLPTDEVESLNLSWRSFNLLMQPACVSGEPRFFLLCVGLALPVGLLMFANWDRLGTLILSSALIVSTVGFEFMTNALRQGVSLPFLLAGFYFDRKLFKFSALAIAMLLHDSSWFFAPLAILIAYRTGALTRRALFLLGIPLVLGLSCLFYLRFFTIFGQLSTLLDFYSKSYAEKPSVPFLVFIILPVLLLYGVRRLLDRSGLTSEETTTFWYSAVVLSLSLVMFQEITYRFAMTAIVLQAFMAMRARGLSMRSSLLISSGLVIHFIIFAIVSKNVVAVFHG
jgi:hypothetical protein